MVFSSTSSPAPSPRRRRAVACLLVLCVWDLSAASPSDDPTASAGELDFFEKRIRPVLVEHCYRCHSAGSKKVKGALRLDTRAAIRRGGESGHPAVVPGEPEKSVILAALRYEDLEMPPDRRLPERVIADFEKWIRMGAPDPRGEPEAATASGDAKARAATIPRAVDTGAGRGFWSFQRPRRHARPAVSDPSWPLAPIDPFILARLEAAGLEPSAPADRGTFVRRVSFDLTGLPPTPEEVDRFVNDPAPDAYERLVDRLLASPGYGERWARLWLDVARYAEDQAHIVGDNESLFYPNAYLYRNWVIEALNEDMPYDRFIELQLAADALELPESPHQAALGFLGLGPKYYRRGALEVQADEWEDRVDTVSRGLLGLTVACARCHDHKYDPISTEDYHALAGVFASTDMYNRPLDDKREMSKDGQAKSPRDSIHIVRDMKEPKDLNIFIRGDVNVKGPVVPRHFLRVLSDGEPPPFKSGSGRLDLARAVADQANPLTARVLVNRVWAQLFGRAIVGTPSNLGALGERPTHPELLDDLAVRFMESGWSIKSLLRELVLSATYRQSSGARPEGLELDPAGRLLWRMPRRRLAVEAWRDALLSAAGRLERALGGPSIDPQDPSVRRRTIYSTISRFELNPMLALFDFPDPNIHSAQRTRTTTPLQKLFLLNSRFMNEQAETFARRLAADSASGSRRAVDTERIHAAYTMLFGRHASEDELRAGLRFLHGESDPEKAWTSYCQALLASSEMAYVD